MELSEYFKKNWSKIELDHLLFVFDQAEKRLEETVETAKLSKSKGKWVFGSFLGLLSALIVASSTIDIPDELKLSAVFLVINIVLILFFSALTLKKHTIFVTGTMPERLLIDNYFVPFKSFNLAYKNTLLSLCIDHNHRISDNKTINARTLKHYNRAIKFIYFIPLSILLGYLVYLLFAFLPPCLLCL